MFVNNDNSDKFSIKYENDVPENYDVCEIQFIFDFIYLVFKHNASIDGAIQGVANEYNLSEVYLKDFLIENKYILIDNDFNSFSHQLKKYSTKSLKKILKTHGLKNSGKRVKLEERIFENDLFDNIYKLSSKSKIFYKNKKRRFEIFDDYLSEYYYFKEFNDFYMENFRKKYDMIPVAFIKQFIDKSIEDKNHKDFIFNNQIMVEYFDKIENYKKMLEYVLTIFCMNINPIWKINDLKIHDGVYLDNYQMLLFLKEKLGKNFIFNAFYLVWDSFNFDTLIISKYSAYLYLKDILNLKDYNSIIKNLSKNVYLNENLKIKRFSQKTLFDF